MKEFRINHRFDMLSDEFFLIDPDRHEYGVFEDGRLIMRPSTEGAIMAPLFTLPNFHEELPNALFQALAKDGAKLPEQSFLSGKIEATERHLEDMRKLVFKE